MSNNLQLKTVNSLSCGKTSSYMAVHYPTDINIFACVLTNHKESSPKDKGLIKEIQKRLPNFQASLESESTLKAILDLEQKIGKKITWVSSEFTFEQLVYKQTDMPRFRNKKPYLPNKSKRICTENLKVKPIQEYLYMHHYNGLPFLMNIGFRFDEFKRVEKWDCKNDKFNIATSANLYGQYRYNYQKNDFRISQFPLYEDKITKEDVQSFWKSENIKFPEISNCRFCFFHTDFQLQLMAQQEKKHLQYWLDMKRNTNNTFGDRPLEDRIANPFIPGFLENISCVCTD